MKMRFLLYISFFIPICVYAQSDPDPLRYEEAIDKFAELDEGLPGGQAPVLFIGSSSFTYWGDIENVFKPYNAINRAFGGSQASDVLYYFDRVVKKYSPKLIVFYEGDNDIHSGKTPKQFFNDFMRFVEKVRKELPGTEIAFVSIKPSPSRKEKVISEYKKANKLVEKESQRSQDLHFINIWDAMLDSNGKPEKSLFIEDMLHMNEKGYRIWEEIVGHFLASWENQ